MRSNILVLGWTMLAFLFGRLPRRTPANDVRPGNRYRRQLGSHLAATATVLDLRSDLVGVPRVQFSVTVDGSATRLSEGDTRILLSNPSSIPIASVLRRKPNPIQTAHRHWSCRLEPDILRPCCAGEQHELGVG